MRDSYRSLSTSFRTVRNWCMYILFTWKVHLQGNLKYFLKCYVCDPYLLIFSFKKCNDACSFGEFCQNVTDPCSNNDCLNGGICTASSCQSTCTCPPQFTGDNCEVNVNPCLRSNCLNGDSCVLTSNTT